MASNTDPHKVFGRLGNTQICTDHIVRGIPLGLQTAPDSGITHV